MRFFSEYFICHFYILWPKILHIIFTAKTIYCSKFFPIFIGFISDFVFFIFCNLAKCCWHIVLILLILSLQLFFKIISNFINHFICYFFSRNFDMYTLILPANLKTSKLRSLRLQQKVMLLNMPSLSFSSISHNFHDFPHQLQRYNHNL